MDHYQNKLHAPSEQRPDDMDISDDRWNIVGPCSCKHHADSPICDENGNFMQKLRGKFFNYLRRVAE